MRFITLDFSDISIALAVARKPVKIAPTVIDELRIPSPVGKLTSFVYQTNVAIKPSMYGPKFSMKRLFFISFKVFFPLVKNDLQTVITVFTTNPAIIA